MSQRERRPSSGQNAGLRQELVVCGFIARGGKDGEVCSLPLGYCVGNQLDDAGSVGTAGMPALVGTYGRESVFLLAAVSIRCGDGSLHVKRRLQAEAIVAFRRPVRWVPA